MQDAGPLASQLLLLSCLCVAVSGYPFRPPLDLDVTPRVTVLISGLQGSRRFQSSTVNYSTLLLDADRERLYVGARGAVFALDATDISASPAASIEWEASAEQKFQCLLKGKDNKTECFNHIRLLQRFNSTHLYMCGTHAFSPLCAYIDEERFVMSSKPEEGRDKCPYGPTTGYTGLLVDQQLYTASQYEFRSFPDIRRNSPSPTLKTEDAPTRWLNEAEFVGSSLLKERLGSGGDDQIFFFFTERNQEYSGTYSHSRVARVGRVCKGDRGGHLTLQKRWTSFLKARLTCSLPDYDFHFNMLRSVFVMPDLEPQETLFYGIFGLEWKNVKASAVCRFSLSEVQKAFQGPYMENQDSGSKWTEYTGKIPEPRPGTCINDALRARGINISTSLPDDVLEFVRRHPLMSHQVQPLDKRPVLFRRTTDYTHMAAHVVQGLDGETYHVLYMGTDEGWLHKAVEVQGQIHIIEELQLFEEPQPITNLLMSTKQASLYVGSPSGVVQLPLSNCGRYSTCYECVFARDPHCAWNGGECVDVTAQANRSSFIQDIQHGNRGCEKAQYDVAQKSRSVRVGDDVLLQCELISNLATPLWTLNGKELQGYDLNSGFRTGTDGLLVIEAQVDQSGLYTCHAVENNIRVAIVTYNVTIVVDLPPPPPVDPAPKLLVTPSRAVERSYNERTSLEPPSLLLTPSKFLSPKNMEALYLSLITVLSGIVVVLAVVLVYMGFCLRAGQSGKYSLRAAAAAYPRNHKKSRKTHRNSSHMELKTISSHCNGNGICNGISKPHNGSTQELGVLQIVPGEGYTSPTRETLPPAPPLPSTPQHPSPECNFPNGLAATLPSVLRRMNGNSYILLRQSDSESSSSFSFAEELNRILEKRKHTQLLPIPDESSV
ncbi:Semaphorin-4G [Oryzias melastigma]|uniref:Semaphorin-4G n=1 Tax=Oryzias melastigma TaxID=30732 RepID=A0A3B3BDU9_ORYME|nr:semaphorin-4G isoform X1 [Oryzias melastigma]KAF6731453.1 Semaphorin-4G [Oryzias melastigma]